MSKSTPSLPALLALVAVAGYQNRGRISEMLSEPRDRTAAYGTYPANVRAGVSTEIGQPVQGQSIVAALGDLVDRFRAAGQGDAADSWVSDRPNMPLGVDALKAALGHETLSDLAGKTGLSPADVLLRLNVALPDVVNSFTPDGRLPAEGDVQPRL